MRISDWSSDVCSSDLAAALGGVAGAGERAQRHAVKAVGEGDDHLAPRDLARQLDRRLDRVGAGGTGEHHALVETARFQAQRLKGFEKGRLRVGVEGEPVDRQSTRLTSSHSCDLVTRLLLATTNK